MSATFTSPSRELVMCVEAIGVDAIGVEAIGVDEIGVDAIGVLPILLDEPITPPMSAPSGVSSSTIAASPSAADHDENPGGTGSCPKVVLPQRSDAQRTPLKSVVERSTCPSVRLWKFVFEQPVSAARSPSVSAFSGFPFSGAQRTSSQVVPLMLIC
jgi:hypothetical protein